MLRGASNNDLASIQSMLKSFDLPYADIANHLNNFLVIEREKGLVAVGAYESAGRMALLRSIAVSKLHRGKGLGDRV